MILYGVDPMSISKKVGEPKDLAGRPYTSSAQSSIVEREAGYTTQSLVNIFTLLADRYLVILMAACKARRLTQAAYFFEEAVFNCLYSLSLQDQIRDIVGSKEKFSHWTGVKLATLGAPYKLPFEPLYVRGLDFEQALQKAVEKARSQSRKKKV